MRSLGIDYGDKRIGLAISDELRAFAHPYRTLPLDAQLFSEIGRVIEREKIDEIIVGLPKNMDGTMGPAALKARSFADKLAGEFTSTKILMWDERLTTVQAQKTLHLLGRNTKKSKKIIDQVAAQILLQNYLDSLQWTSQAKQDGR
jgi:putative holliday junction resolvase